MLEYLNVFVFFRCLSKRNIKLPFLAKSFQMIVSRQKQHL